VPNTSAMSSGEEDNTYAFFCYRSNDDRALHVPLVVDNDTGIVLRRRSAQDEAGDERYTPRSKGRHHLAAAKPCAGGQPPRASLWVVASEHTGRKDGLMA